MLHPCTIETIHIFMPLYLVSNNTFDKDARTENMVMLSVECVTN